MQPRAFCPFCATRLGPLDGSRQACGGCGRPFFHNAAPCVAVVIADGERVLLARRAIEPEKGKWDLPGGFCDAGEDPADAVRREIREETGCEVEIVRFLGHVVDIYGDGGDHTLNCVYEVAIAAGVPSPADDVAELRWFGADELPPPDELAFANTGEALTRFRQRH